MPYPLRRRSFLYFPLSIIAYIYGVIVYRNRVFVYRNVYKQKSCVVTGNTSAADRLKETGLNASRSEHAILFKHIGVKEIHLHRLVDSRGYCALAYPNLVSNKKRHIVVPPKEIPLISIDISQQAD